MKISIGFNPSCSETVIQICGITKDISEKLAKVLREMWADIYKPDVIDHFIERDITGFTGKYNLELNRIDGDASPENWEYYVVAAKKMGLSVGNVSCCSDPIDNDIEMDSHMEQIILGEKLDEILKDMGIVFSNDGGFFDTSYLESFADQLWWFDKLRDPDKFRKEIKKFQSFLYESFGGITDEDPSLFHECSFVKDIYKIWKKDKKKADKMINEFNKWREISLKVAHLKKAEEDAEKSEKKLKKMLGYGEKK